MSLCTKCSKSFPNRIIIDGKMRNLQKRKRCFECSPFGKHNTRSDAKHINSDCKCTICKREYKYCKSGGNSHSVCSPCAVNKRRFRIKDAALDFCGSKCFICGYDRCKKSLSFHHLDPKSKKFNISSSHCRSWESIELELKKCVLLCQNCHNELHDNMFCLLEETITWKKSMDYDKNYNIPKTKIPPTENKCKTCGFKISKNATYCNKCSHIGLKHKINWPPLEELENLLKNKPCSKVAKELGVSDKAICKHIKAIKDLKNRISTINPTASV